MASIPIIQAQFNTKTGLYELNFPTGTRMSFYCLDDAAQLGIFFSELSDIHTTNFEAAIIESVLGGTPNNG